MKTTLEVKKIGNVWILEVDGKKFVCKSPMCLKRKLWDVVVENKPMVDQYDAVSRSIKNMWNDNVGVVEKRVLSFIEKKGHATIEEIVMMMKKHYQYPDIWQLRSNLKYVMKRLSTKGYV